jgi:hypothetical protein
MPAVWDGLTPIRWRRGTLVDLRQIGMAIGPAKLIVVAHI